MAAADAREGPLVQRSFLANVGLGVGKYQRYVIA